MDVDVFNKNVDKYEEFQLGFFEHASPQVKQLYEELFKKLNFSEDQEVLEVGIGSGLNLRFYPKGIRLIGLDISQEMLNKARDKNKEQGKGAIITCEDATRLQYEDNKFDRVVATFLLCATLNPGKVIKEMLRVCKSQGLIGLFDYHKADENSSVLGDQFFLNETMKRGLIYKDVPVIVFDTLYNLDKILKGLSVKFILDTKITNSFNESFRATILQKQ